MNYKLKDRFLLNGIYCEVGYINQGKAWLFPVYDGEQYKGTKLLMGLAFDVVNEKGRNAEGKKLVSIPPIPCLAV